MLTVDEFGEGGSESLEKPFGQRDETEDMPQFG
jgi:hypothetical protein